ncbi:hypothetical protein COBT_002276 [Conglomerata obtusa]
MALRTKIACLYMFVFNSLNGCGNIAQQIASVNPNTLDVGTISSKQVKNLKGGKIIYDKELSEAFISKNVLFDCINFMEMGVNDSCDDFAFIKSIVIAFICYLRIKNEISNKFFKDTFHYDIYHILFNFLDNLDEVSRIKLCRLVQTHQKNLVTQLENITYVNELENRKIKAHPNSYSCNENIQTQKIKYNGTKNHIFQKQQKNCNRMDRIKYKKNMASKTLVLFKTILNNRSCGCGMHNVRLLKYKLILREILNKLKTECGGETVEKSESDREYDRENDEQYRKVLKMMKND